VLVLWVMVVLSAVALQLSFSSHLRLQTTAGIGQGTKALYLARAGVERTIADLASERYKAQTLPDLRESETTTYCNVELGDGAYTLFAGLDDDGEATYGIMDEAGKINVNTAETSVLAGVPGMNAELIAEIMTLRQQQPLRDLNDLLLLERMEPRLLFGEDANGNGLLDANEDDGDESWPPDNSDGRLDCGLAGLLTTWSAARQVTAQGGERVDLNSADAKKLEESVSGLTAQEAESIVEHRKQKKFESIADLLDVELLTKTTEKQKSDNDKKEESKESNQSPASKEGSGDGASSGDSSSDSAKKQDSSKEKQSQPKVTYQSTGRKAFDTKRLQKIADAVTTTDEKVIKGAVNVNTAPPEVLMCLPGITEQLARRIVRYRSEREHGFESVADLLNVEGVSVALFKQLCPKVGARSDVFSVRSFGVLKNGEMCRCVHAVIDRTEDKTRIPYWRELE